ARRAPSPPFRSEYTTEVPHEVRPLSGVRRGTSRRSPGVSRSMRLLLAAVFAASPAGVGAAPSCNRPLPTAPQGLPSRVVVTTQCGTYGIDRDGSVAVAKPVPLDTPPWRVGLRRGHLVLFENGKAV